MGIVGLAVFGINKRRKQIGTRRALGATRAQILRYFMLENIFVTAIGVLLGAVLTLALSILLTTNFNMPTMAWYYTPAGMLALIVIGQLAVFGPASGTARIEPAIATRSVQGQWLTAYPVPTIAAVPVANYLSLAGHAG